jgi:hypothetical protein
MANLGDKVRDRINGFTGIVTGRAEYLYGCVQVLVAPQKTTKEGKRPDSEWLDEDRVEVLKAGVHGKPASAATRAGGPQSTPAPIR